jgi:deoxyribodipyrimidine photolyase-related protein
MTNLRLILSDQLSESITSLSSIDKKNDVVIMFELIKEFTHVKHHKKKIAFILSAMRHFAKGLKEADIRIDYTCIDDPGNTQDLKSEMKRSIQRHKATKIIVTSPSEYRILKDIQQYEKDFNIPIEIRPDNRFLYTPEEFKKWANDRKQLRMEYFYREVRKRYNIFMNGNDPEGGQWNYDAQNRKTPAHDINIPKSYQSEPDEITHETIELVEKYFPSHFGDLDPFYFAVTRDHAKEALDHFIKQRLVSFGDYQDAMIQNEPWMFHSHISFYLNCGLLTPLECVKAAEDSYRQGQAPINAVEGFIRQIIGWREYIRGIYWLKMPEYKEENFFNATRNLPDFYWHGNSKMNCLNQCIQETKKNAYAHHIQRLMVLGNFALLAGIDPRQVNEWFLIVYADAYEWVELPNVSGMILFADGGYLASKPYAASGNYVNKMSNYCKNCSYKVSKNSGKDACPFNYLYWDFLVRNRKSLESNPRMAMMYRTYDKMDDSRKSEIELESNSFLQLLNESS